MHLHNWDYRAVLLALFLSCGTAFAQGTPSAVIGAPVLSAAPSGAAGGDLGGTYPNPTVIGGSHLTGTLASGLAIPNPTLSGTITLSPPPVAGNAVCYIGGTLADCTVAPAAVGTGLSLSGGSIVNNATDHISYQPGLLTAVNATIAVFHTFSKASTVNNIIGSASTFSCVSNPTITMYECGTSTTCAGPTTIGTVTVTAAGTRVTGSISSSAITAGDSVGFAMTAGTCASIDISATAEISAN